MHKPRDPNLGVTNSYPWHPKRHWLLQLGEECLRRFYCPMAQQREGSALSSHPPPRVGISSRPRTI